MKQAKMFSKEIGNRRTGIYRTKDPITNFKIRVKLKQINTFINLPPLYDDDNEVDPESQDNVEERIVTWQQKIFSKEEREIYGIRENCISDQQIKYHEQIIQTEATPTDGSVFTYIDGDNEEPSAEPYVSTLHKGMESLRLQNERENVSPNRRQTEEIIVRESSHYVDNEYSAMRIMASVNPDEELCALRWYPRRDTLIVYPDFNRVSGPDDDSNWYTITVDTDGRKVYRYSLEHASAQEETTDERVKEIEMKNKLSKRLPSPSVPAFAQPGRRRAFSVLLLEISRGLGFPGADQPALLAGGTYVRYGLDAPPGWTVPRDGQVGCTSCDAGAAWGHAVELALVRDLDIAQDDTDGALQPKLYFEVISRDYWNRHRTEGFGVLVLRLTSPGMYEAQVPCIRPKLGMVDALKRRLIGGCDNLDDLAWLSGYPSAKDGGKCIRYGVQTVSTGTLHVKYSVITQHRLPAQAGLALRRARQGGAERQSLLRSVDDVVGAYRLARRQLREARGLPGERDPALDEDSEGQ